MKDPLTRRARWQQRARCAGVLAASLVLLKGVSTALQYGSEPKTGFLRVFYIAGVFCALLMSLIAIAGFLTQERVDWLLKRHSWELWRYELVVVQIGPAGVVRGLVLIHPQDGRRYPLSLMSWHRWRQMQTTANPTVLVCGNPERGVVVTPESRKEVIYGRPLRIKLGPTSRRARQALGE